MYVGWLFQILLNRNISLKCVSLRAGSSYGFGDIVWAKKNKSLCNEADFTAQRLSFSLPKLQEYPPNPQGEPEVHSDRTRSKQMLNCNSITITNILNTQARRKQFRVGPAKIGYV